MRTRVLHILTCSSWGGVPQVVSEIIRGLAPEKYAITLACGIGDGWERMGELGVEVIPIKHLKRDISVVDDLRALCQLYSIMKKGHYDIVHCHSGKAGLLGRLAARLAGVRKVFFTVHGWSFYNTLEYGWARPLMVLLEKVAARCSTKIICVSEADRVSGLARRIAKEDKFLVIHNGIGWNGNGDRIHARQLAGIDNNHIVLGMVGRLAHQKNPMAFLRAAREIRRDYPDVRFILVGGGPLMDECIDFIRDNGLAECVQLLGEKSPEQTHRLIASFDVFVLTSEFEGLPLTVIEAMFAGLPILATNVGGVPELVEHGGNGFLVQAGNVADLTARMRFLIDDAETRGTMGRASQKRAQEEFHRTGMVASYDAVYASLGPHRESRPPAANLMRAMAPQGNTHQSLLILCQLFYPELVSTGQTMTEFAEQLAALGGDVEVLCGPPTILGRRQRVPKCLVHQGIRIRRVWGTRFPKLSFLGRLVNQLSFACSAFLRLLITRPKKPILVLTNPPFLAMACALLRKLKLGPPYLYLVFDVYPDTPVRLGLLRDRAWLVRIWDRLNQFAYRHASTIIVIGRCMRDVVERKLRAADLALPGKLQHIPVWCDDEAIRATTVARPGLAAEFGVQSKFVVGYFGNMGRIHDLETIMGAAELLREEPDIAFLFVGEGHKKQWAMRRARERGLDNCRFHGYVARQDLTHLLALADVGLVSLLSGQEGLSVPSKTYGLMAAGVPVLAVMSGVSEIARMVQEVRCGVWVCPGDTRKLADAILELKRDRLRAEAMATRGIRAIEDVYNLKNVCRRYVDLLAEVSQRADRPEMPMPSPDTTVRWRQTVDERIAIRERQTPSQGISKEPAPSGR